MHGGLIFLTIWDGIDLSTILIIIAYLISISLSLMIISENRQPAKTLAYLVTLFALPFIGVIIYFIFGENYRKKKLYSKKFISDTGTYNRFVDYMARMSDEALRSHIGTIKGNAQLVSMLVNDSKLPLSVNNKVKILLNGEEKFPAVLEELEKAKHHIHIEYYIYEDSDIANKIKEVLIRKSREGVQVRLMYDDFGSSISRSYQKELTDAGVQMAPFFKVYLHLLANRNNYRDHRKIIIVDGVVGFTGGINVSDKYINDPKYRNEYYWRDTHLQINGDAVKLLQFLFFMNWNFCCDNTIPLSHDYFPDHDAEGSQLVQIAYSGPDSDRASVMLSYFAAINNAREYIYLTTPYFIPNESILNSLKKAALSKVDVRLLVPGISDSRFVNAAAQSYYEEIMEAGVKVYLYEKGFVHAKTLIADHSLSMVGSANIDYRSFDFNFELNAVVFDEGTHNGLKDSFMIDLENSREIVLEEWKKRSRRKKLFESCCRLL